MPQRLHADRGGRRHADGAGRQPGKVPAKNAKEFIALLKAKPGDYNYASSGNGTILHLASEMFLDAAGVDGKPHPVQGRRPDGDRPHRRPGRLRHRRAAERAGPSEERRAARDRRAWRSSASASRPTFRPSPSRASRTIASRLVRGDRPEGLPAAEVKRLHDAVVAASTTPRSRKRWPSRATSSRRRRPKRRCQFFRSEQERYGKLVKKANITLE